MLWKPTPEGARDFVVPSRLQPGRFFALPQSPQIAKQLLVISGFERYYQIARCFRDEDLRADRLQELTQLDVEMAFPDQDFLFGLMERIVERIWRETIGVELKPPFRRMPYDEAMLRFGIDRPDLRFGMEIQEATADTRGSEFGVFANAEAVRYIAVPKEYSRSELQALENHARSWGAKGLAYIVFRADGEVSSPIAKFLSDDLLERLRQPGHTLLFVADEPRIVAKVLGLLRLQLGRELELIDESQVGVPLDRRHGRCRVHRGDRRLAGRAPPVHAADRGDARPVRHRPRRGPRGRVRPRRQRHRARRRLVPDPRAGAAAAGLRVPRASAPRSRRRNSASCSRRSGWARPRTAASPRASTA